jgi:coenzyme F420-reducing hydrogenase alpha subunit
VLHSSKVDDAAPDLGFGCCNVGLVFGGDDEKGDDSAAYRAFQRKQYEEKAKEQADREESLRQSYLKQQGRKDSVQIIAESKSRKEVLSRP